MKNEDLSSVPLLYDWIEMSELLNMLRISRNTLKDWCASYGLKCSRVKKRIYFLRQDIELILYSNYKNYKL